MKKILLITVLTIIAVNAELPSEKTEWGVRSIEIDKSFAINKKCLKYYENTKKFNTCVKSTSKFIDEKYQKLDKNSR